MKRKIPLILICALCLAFLSSCGGNTNPAQQPEPNKQVVEQESDPWQEQYDLGMQYLSEGNDQEAIAAFTAAIEIDPKRALSYVGRGDGYVLSGETEENLAAALADYQAALALDETVASAWLGIADVYIRQGLYDQAPETLREGLEKTGDDPAIADKLAEVEAGSIADSSGNIRRLNGYNSSGELAWYHIYDYNESGRKSAVTSYDAEGVETGHMELVYDEEGRMLKSYSYLLETGEIEDSYSEYEYDSSGNKIKDTYYSSDGIPEVYELFEYDDDGICVHSERYEADNDQLSYTVDYDEQGRKTQITWYDNKGSVHGYYTYEYNEFGRQSRCNNYNADWELREYHISLYDETGKFVGEEFYNADGSLQSSTGVES